MASTILGLPYDFDPVALHQFAPDRYPYLLQSVASNPEHGRYDIVFAYPEQTLRARYPEDRFLDNLDAHWAKTACATDCGPPPFSGGWFLCLAYELVTEIEPSLELAPWAGGFTAFATRIPIAVIRDHKSHRAWAIAEPGFESRLKDISRDLAASRDCRDTAEPVGSIRPLQEPAHEHYARSVRAAQAYIKAGDIFQANLSREWRATDWRCDLPHLYKALRRTNPAPFAGLVRWAGGGLASSSPERLIGIRDGRVFTRPIAGTRPRDRGPELDLALSRELFASSKERAEHVMLIDLERNDLGRICAPGSISVDEFMVPESYAHVHHIVSNVSGELRGDVTPGNAIAAVFPGGTITGVPKVRCIEVINELEDRARGPYTGSIGYLGRDGSMDLNILIRTFVQSGSDLSLRAGAGIVADSRPEQELAETRAKAKGLLLAVAEMEHATDVVG
jgi:anthranilate synthase component 1